MDAGSSLFIYLCTFIPPLYRTVRVDMMKLGRSRLFFFYFLGFPSNFLHVVCGRFYKNGENIWCCCPALVTSASCVEGLAYSGCVLRDCTQCPQPNNEVCSWVSGAFVWYLDGVNASYPTLRLIRSVNMVKALPLWPQQGYSLKCVVITTLSVAKIVLFRW